MKTMDQLPGHAIICRVAVWSQQGRKVFTLPIPAISLLSSAVNRVRRRMALAAFLYPLILPFSRKEKGRIVLLLWVFYMSGV